MSDQGISPPLAKLPIGQIDPFNSNLVLPTLQFLKQLQLIFNAVTTGPGTGTVTSVGLALPVPLFSVSGSPVTGAGTLSASLKTQTANFIWAGPTSGAAAAPTFRRLTAADIPNVLPTGITVLGQSGLPMIVAGSGSMGNNGALTLTTALGTTYPNAYVYMPAAAIAAGSLAGWYYTTFSSATAGTLFNNTYANGTPVIPASPTAFVSTGPGAYTGSSAAQTAYSLSITANTLGINGGIRASLAASYTNTAANKTFTLAYDGTTFGTAVLTTTQTLAAIWGFKNRGVANVQAGLTAPSAIPFGAGTTALDYGAVDSTLSKNVTLVITNATPATNNAVLENITVELLPTV